MSPTLVAAIVSLVLWVVLAFVLRLPSGVVHLPLAIGTTLWVRWWAVTR